MQAYSQDWANFRFLKNPVFEIRGQHSLGVSSTRLSVGDTERYDLDFDV
jgi:hypothetical protein